MQRLPVTTRRWRQWRIRASRYPIDLTPRLSAEVVPGERSHGSRSPARVWPSPGRRWTEAERHAHEVDGETLEAGHEVLTDIPEQHIDTRVHGGREYRHVFQRRRRIAHFHDDIGLNVHLSADGPPGAAALNRPRLPRPTMLLKQVEVPHREVRARGAGVEREEQPLTVDVALDRR